MKIIACNFIILILSVFNLYLIGTAYSLSTTNPTKSFKIKKFSVADIENDSSINQISELMCDLDRKRSFTYFKPLAKTNHGLRLKDRLTRLFPHHCCIATNDNNDNDNDNDVIGFGEVGLMTDKTTNTEYPLIGNIVVKSSHRRLGIAQEIIHNLEETVKSWTLYR